MTKRIFRSICTVAIAVFFASLILIMGMLYNYFTGIQQESLRAQTELAAHAAELAGDDFFSETDIGNYRITHISADGTVLYESAGTADLMENHLEREEVTEALKNGIGESTRYSSTLMQRQLYCAIRLTDGTVLRLSISQNTVLTLIIGMLRPIVIVAAIAVILSLVLASRTSKRIVKPLNEIDLENPLSNEDYDELSPLLRRIDAQKRQIKSQERKLAKRKNEFDTVTRSMGEGLVLLSPDGTVLSINRSASRLFGGSRADSGENILSLNRTLDMQELLKSAAAGLRDERIINIEGRDYRFSVSPVATDEKINGIVLLIFDVTEKIQSEKLRREFTANVSHELKTPLHTISGCAELLAEGMVKPEDTKQFAGQIYGEAGRMIQLVDDIIKLSHLDEGAEEMQFEKAGLAEIAESVISACDLAAQSAGVSLSLSGDRPEINCIPRLVNQIIYNLCDNAVKYNREGGSVNIEITETDKNVKLKVSDTGIGISPEHRERIFERFYRVDKSHSKEVGGTGLGLSIVKHAAKIHGADICVDSTVGEGTTITVVFPK